MIRRPPRSTLHRSSAASDVYKRQHTDKHSHTHTLTHANTHTYTHLLGYSGNVNIRTYCICPQEVFQQGHMETGTHRDVLSLCAPVCRCFREVLLP